MTTQQAPARRYSVFDKQWGIFRSPTFKALFCLDGQGEAYVHVEQRHWWGGTAYLNCDLTPEKFCELFPLYALDVALAAQALGIEVKVTA